MADKTPLGMEFMNWQNLPSITEKLKGGNSPLLNMLGIAAAGGGSEPSSQAMAPEAMGQGVSPPSVPGGVGINMQNQNGLGIAPSQFSLPNLSLPQIGQQSAQPGIDLDGDGVVDNFWGVKK